jgi:hypothetical protein
MPGSQDVVPCQGPGIQPCLCSPSQIGQRHHVGIVSARDNRSHIPSKSKPTPGKIEGRERPVVAGHREGLSWTAFYGFNNHKTAAWIATTLASDDRQFPDWPSTSSSCTHPPLLSTAVWLPPAPRHPSTENGIFFPFSLSTLGPSPHRSSSAAALFRLGRP